MKKYSRTIVYFVTITLIITAAVAFRQYNYASVDSPIDHQLARDVASSRMLVVPDIYLGRNIANRSKHDTNYPFEKLDSLHREKYNAWIANFECPSVNGVEEEGVAFDLSDFNCDPAFLPYMAKYFNYVSRANNHAYNQDNQVGFYETTKNLQDNGIASFGNFSPAESKGNCKVVGLESDKTIALPVALCGYHFVVEPMQRNVDEEIAQYSKYMPVIVMPHSGNEYSNNISDAQRERYHRMIDAGADVVLGAHPHVVEPAEVYEGKLIVYSLGNFIMDQIFSAQTTQGVAMDILLNFKNYTDKAVHENIEHLNQLAGECNEVTAFECADLLESSSIKKPEYTLNYFPLAVQIDLNSLQTANAPRKVYDTVMDQLAWADLKHEMKHTSDGFYYIQ